MNVWTVHQKKAVVERWPFNSGGLTVMKNDCCIKHIPTTIYLKKNRWVKKQLAEGKTVHVYSMAKELKLMGQILRHKML